jgi:hypothetical protein
MCISILTLPLRKKSDVLLARQRARQIAKLLGFDRREQACIAAGVFAVASTARQHAGRCAVVFQLEGDVLQVVPVLGRRRRPSLERLLQQLPSGTRNLLRLEKPLPVEGSVVNREDLPWFVEELARLIPLNVFDEIEQQNQELLHTLHELHAVEPEQPQAHQRPQKPAA